PLPPPSLCRLGRTGPRQGAPLRAGPAAAGLRHGVGPARRRRGARTGGAPPEAGELRLLHEAGRRGGPPPRPGPAGAWLRRSLFRLLFGWTISDVPFPAFSPLPPSWQLIAKIPDPRQVEHLGGQFQRTAVKAADGARPLDQV